MKRITVQVDSNAKRDIQLAAAKLGLTMAAFCRMVILEKINKNGNG